MAVLVQLGDFILEIKNRNFFSQYKLALGANTFPSFLFFFILAFLIFNLGQSGHSAQVSLTWDPNSEADLAGYKIYSGVQSKNYSRSIDVGNVTSHTLDSLDLGMTYYIAATAYNTKGLESGFSNEVIYTVPSCSFSISPANASFSASGGSGSVSITTQAGCNWVTSASIPWITITSGSGTGSGTMRYTVATNTGSTRTASLTIAGNVFTVTETGLTNYLITASAGAGGSISPSGQVSVLAGSGQTFSIAPNSGYRISNVTVDGVSRGAITSYTFSSVNANHTITASFTLITSATYNLSISTNGTGNGSVTTNPAGTIFSAGTGVTLTAASDSNSIFSGWSGACSGSSSTCQITMNSNLTVTATFNIKSYIVTASAGTGGSISPSGQVSVNAAANQIFTITPNSGYRISSVIVDGVAQGANTTYTFSSVNANHTITASFTLNSTVVSGAPIVSTNAAGSVTLNSATLKGTVNPNGLSTTYLFQWGRTTSYGSSTAVTSAGSGTNNVAATANLTGLTAGKTYHYRLVATNSTGTTYGTDGSFFTGITNRYDFNNDGKTDLLWRHKVSGDVAVWYMNGATLISSAVIFQGVPLEWELTGTGDFNNDGKTDLLWRHKGRGDVAVWYMNGATLISSAVIFQGVPLEWELTGTGDFNNDWKTDLLWKHKVSGDVAIWYMNGATLINSAVIYQGMPLEWEMAGTGDFNSDGKTDLLWSHKIRGDVAVWYMNGATLINSAVIYQGVPLDWELYAH